MKTSNVLVSLLFGSLAIAAPVDKRALLTKTETVIHTVVVYTTVWDGEVPATAAAVPTTIPGLFYERPHSQANAEPTSTAPAYTPPAESPAPSSEEPAQEPSSKFVPPVPSSVHTPPPPPPSPPSVQEPPKPTPTKISTPAGPGGGQVFTGDLTIYDNTGGFGACGKALYDTDFVVALALPAWGESTYDVMTGEATNPWCGQKITVEYNGNTIEAEIQDMCPGCTGHDIDLSLAAWKALTGLDEKTRLQGKWWKS